MSPMLSGWRCSGRIKAITMALSILTASPVLQGHWRLPEPVPVDRLVANLTAYTKAHPDDPEGYYVLGRAHSLAFTLRATTIKYFPSGRSKDGLPDVPDESFQWRDERAEPNNPPVPTSGELRLHLRDSISNYRKAIELSPRQAHYRLGLAYTLEQGVPLATDLEYFPPVAGQPAPKDQPDAAGLRALAKKLADPNFEVREDAHRQLLARGKDAIPLLYTTIHSSYRREDNADTINRQAREIIRAYWLEFSIASYLQAYELAIEKDLKEEEQPLRGLKVLTSYEAGASYVRLVRGRGMRDNERGTFKKVEQDVYALERKPPNGAITPIIFSTEPGAPLSALLDGQRKVLFDLDGDGNSELWPWVKPTTGFLVWDPDGSGHITSGRQMFGSVTWWMFFTDGYHALDALDDNRDGTLTDEELEGLSVWFDRNSDGIADTGEVVPLCKLGIVSISTRVTERVAGCPASSQGLRMKDGRIVPTYDWIATPAQAAEQEN